MSATAEKQERIKYGSSLKLFNQVCFFAIKILIFIFPGIPDFSITSQALKCNAMQWYVIY